MSQTDLTSESNAGLPPSAEAYPLLSGLPEVGEFTRLALWISGALAGLTTITHASQRRHFRSLAKRLRWPVGTALSRPRPGMESAMALLSDATIGTTRAAIASVFGPPRCALTDGHLQEGDAIWSGQVWYYAIANPAADAIAIEFTDDEVAGRVVFVRVS